jgi:hypothetical protein
MGWLSRIFGIEAPVEPKTEPLREAAGGQVDQDEHEFRRLTGTGTREINQVTTERARELATHLWDTNLLANRLIELPVAYLLAEGVRLECTGDEGQALLDRHWHDPINRWDEKLPGRVRDLSLSGEQCWPVFVSLAGNVRVAYLDPAQIDDTIPDPGNPEEVIGVKTKPDINGNAHTYRTIREGDDEDLYTEKALALRKAMDGQCMYVAINRLPSRTRGKSDLLASIDWLDAYDEFLFNEISRTGQLRAFTWDVTLKGADESVVKKRLAEIKPPEPGSVNVHNDAEEWEPKSPTLNAADTNEAARMFRGHALGGATVPEHWFGTADNVNKSTGDSMTAPTLKVLTMRQRELTNVLQSLGRYVLIQGGITDPRVLKTVRVKWPDLETRDVSRFAAAIQQVIAACVQSIEANLLTHETALQIVAAIAKQLDVEIDVNSEFTKAKDARAKAASDDAFVPAPADMDPPANDANG